jgi:asparagine synthase (glutamine-hydrolysing)
MCGIVGIVRADGGPIAQSMLVAMRDSLTHRGPDDAGLYVAGPVGLGASRLSVLDPTPSGHQPMANEDGSLWIVFNGEIYNYLELASELAAAGYQRVSGSDTEVLLQLYARFGKDCLHRLNGMFAFAIWDARERTLFAGRDRLGIKPFYYHHRNGRFAFASEVKALLQIDPSLARPDLAAVADYMFSGGPLGDKTGFADVGQLEPGHYLTWRDGRLDIRRYWDIAYRYADPRHETDLLAELAWLVDDAVRIHTRSDVPVGAHLSGGLDSSAVASHAARYVRPLKTFSIRFDGGPYYDETRHARTVASYIGAIYLDEVAHPRELAELLPALVYHMDFGLPNWGGFGYFAVSRLAKRHVKVALTGHGGDELFAGYPKHFWATFGSTDMFEAAQPPGHDPSFAQRLRATFRHEGVRGLLRGLGRRLRPRPDSFEDQWVSFHCGDEPSRHPMLHPSFVRELRGYSPREDYLRPLREADTGETLDKCLYHDLRVYLPQLLSMEDRMSMSVSLESRVPLLDHRIVELVARIPPALKVRGRRPKRLLREVVRPLVPESIRERKDKSPFPVPFAQWFTRELSSAVRDILRSPRSLDRGVFHPDRLRADAMSPHWAWQAVNIELWFRIFVDRDRQSVERATSLTAPKGADRTQGLRLGDLVALISPYACVALLDRVTVGVTEVLGRATLVL